MRREEHLQWCKDRALEYVDKGDIAGAIASMGSNLAKHDETKSIAAVVTIIGILMIRTSPQEAREFINGLN